MKNKILLFLALGAMLLTGCKTKGKTSSQSSDGGNSIRPSEPESSEVESSSEEDINLPISSISLTNVQVPVAGENVAPLNTVNKNVEGLQIDTYNSYWLEKNEYGQFYFFSRFFENNKQFLSNRIYQVRFLMTHENGFADNVTATINSETADVELKENGDLIVTYVFPATGNIVVDTIKITGVTAPEADETPSFENIAVDSTDVGKYVIGTEIWVVEINDEPHNFFYTASDESLKFQGGDKYGIKIATQATGAVFDDEVSALVNGEDAEIISNENGIVTFVYYFDRLSGPEQIHEINISGITAPVVGAKPTIDGITISPSTCKVDTASNTFWCYFTGETSTYFFSHGTEDVQFESGKRYCIKIMIKPKNSTTHHISDKDHILVVKVDGIAPANVDWTNSYIRVQVNFPQL